jgi:hypothetical protein
MWRMPFLFMFAIPASVLAQGDTREDYLEALILKTGGRAERDEKIPGRPITAANLLGGAVTDDLLARFVDCKHLYALALTRTAVTSDGMKILSQFPELKSVHLTDNEICTGGLKRMAGIPKLERLAVLNSQLTDAHMTDFASVGKLSYLVFHFDAAHPTGKQLSKLSAVESLRTLIIKSNNRGITDEHLQGISVIEQLEGLQLYDTAITDAGLQAVVKLKRLRELDIFISDITDNRLDVFANTLSLKSLTLFAGKTTPNAAQIIKARAPHVKSFLR